MGRGQNYDSLARALILKPGFGGLARRVHGAKAAAAIALALNMLPAGAAGPADRFSGAAQRRAAASATRRRRLASGPTPCASAPSPAPAAVAASSSFLTATVRQCRRPVRRRIQHYNYQRCRRDGLRYSRRARRKDFTASSEFCTYTATISTASSFK